MSTKTVYIILFRGIGGKTQLPVKPLRESLTSAGFDNVTAYINSGNVVLNTTLPREDVIERIAQICAKEFSFDKGVYALSREEWASLILRNPFPYAVETPSLLHAAILGGEVDESRLATLKSFAVDGEDISVINNVAYLYTPHGFGRSKLAGKFDKGIGVANTARNWNSVLKLKHLADAIID